MSALEDAIASPVRRRVRMVPTAFGEIAITWSEAGVSGIHLPEARRSPGMAATIGEDDVPASIAALAAALAAYAAGERMEFFDVAVDLSGVDAFTQSICLETRRLGYGETATYGELAAAAGFPGLARETGQALGRNPVPIVVPCHRIVAAGGRPGGFSAPGGVRTKLKLLALEGARPMRSPPGQTTFAF